MSDQTDLLDALAPHLDANQYHVVANTDHADRRIETRRSPNDRASAIEALAESWPRITAAGLADRVTNELLPALSFLSGRELEAAWVELLELYDDWAAIRAEANGRPADQAVVDDWVDRERAITRRLTQEGDT